ncbi:MAG: 1-acyl-sn-glycerol-3-phosphate acyltransferase [Betaproteobacteria bacterium]|nr:1-acyl-sn-glycerol-3-phosphate acyltransferase [Rhodocyclales bacterium]
MSLLRGPARLILKLLGWKLLDLPQRPAKAVVIGYPHTSNWDFPLAILTMLALEMDARWLGKDALFRFGFGPVMRGLGGIAVNRRQQTGFVERMAAEFASRSRLLLVIATEGTRSLRPGWKSGFYRIALAAGVPVVIGVVDYSKREAGLVSSLAMSGDADADMARIALCYEGRCGYHHEKASPIRLL